MTKLETLYKAYHDSQFKISDEGCKIPLMGMINGTELLFVGQNPGIPFQKDHIELFREFTSLSYDEQQKVFKKSWIKSMFVKFIINVCNGVNIDFHNNVGVTNIVKYWTQNNRCPTITEADQKLLTCEIELLKPKCVIFLSKFAFNQFKYKNKITTKCLSFDHPAAHRYARSYTNEIINSLKEYV
ncbi:hypothetical protein CMI47_12790 [Candidatus Pacearchaeota archaeon]|nr:hypothetical protein [Candidatus Pacearchaeota archaeon]|tara:strand:+ start:364 stop:918 length:555 start_codon:yes stop_codon:yes gene_type:complete